MSRRESHDASAFYARFTPPEISTDDALGTASALDQVFVGDSRSMSHVADGSVAMVITSPPYFAGKEYEQALGEGHVPADYLDYLSMLTDVFADCVRTLEPGGRVAVNVANLGRRPYRSLSSDIISILQNDLRLLLRGEVIWQKQRAATGSCAWGSFKSPSNPVLRDLTERVVIASKGRFDRAIAPKQRLDRGLPAVASISRDEFLEATTDVWDIPPESATRVGHPAPFPVELPERLIHLYTYVGDLVLDPFLGSGSTAVAAVRAGRHFVGYDLDAAYVELAKRRIAAEPQPEAPDRLTEALPAKHQARWLLDSCGFTDLEPDLRLPGGIEVAFSGCDAGGGGWLFDVVGGFTGYRPGLNRTDALWRAVGKAAVLGVLEPKKRLVVLTTGVTTGAGRVVLDIVCGPDKPIAAVIDMRSPADRLRLAALAAGTC